MTCPRCGNTYITCACGDDEVQTGGHITARAVWLAACASQQQQLDAGITRPVLTTGATRPEHIERYIDSGRISTRGRRWKDEGISKGVKKE